MNFDILEPSEEKAGSVDERSSLEGLRPGEVERRRLNKGRSIAREEIGDNLGVHEGGTVFDREATD